MQNRGMGERTIDKVCFFFHSYSSAIFLYALIKTVEVGKESTRKTFLTW